MTIRVGSIDTSGGGGGGQVNTVTGGAGMTVDDTDPVNLIIEFRNELFLLDDNIPFWDAFLEQLTASPLFRDVDNNLLQQNSTFVTPYAGYAGNDVIAYQIYSGINTSADTDYAHYQAVTDQDGTSNIVGEFSFVNAAINPAEKRIANIEAFTSSAINQGELIFSTLDSTQLRERLGINPSEIIANEQGMDFDYRIEGLTDSDLFFLDAGNDVVGFGTALADSKVHIQDNPAGAVTSVGGTTLTVESNSSNFISLLAPNGQFTGLVNGNPNNNNQSAILWDDGNDRWLIRTSPNTNTFIFDTDKNQTNQNTIFGSLVNTPLAKVHTGGAGFAAALGVASTTLFAEDFITVGHALNDNGGIVFQEADTAYAAIIGNVNALGGADGLLFRTGSASAGIDMLLDSSGNLLIGQSGTPTERIESDAKIRAATAFNLAGVDGFGAIAGTTVTFGGGGSGDIASMTFRGGILTAVTTVP